MRRVIWSTNTAGKTNPSLGQQCPRLPQFRKEFLVEGELQVRRSRASPSAHADADNSLDQLNVAQPPAHYQLVKLRQPFAHVNPVAVMMFIFIELVDRPRPRFKSLPLGRAF